MIKSQGQIFDNPFEKLYQKGLSAEELREAEENIFGFLNLLVEIDRENNQKK